MPNPRIVDSVCLRCQTRTEERRFIAFTIQYTILSAAPCNNCLTLYRSR